MGQVLRESWLRKALDKSRGDDIEQKDMRQVRITLKAHTLEISAPALSLPAQNHTHDVHRVDIGTVTVAFRSAYPRTPLLHFPSVTAILLNRTIFSL